MKEKKTRFGERRLHYIQSYTGSNVGVFFRKKCREKHQKMRVTKPMQFSPCRNANILKDFVLFLKSRPIVFYKRYMKYNMSSYDIQKKQEEKNEYKLLLWFCPVVCLKMRSRYSHAIPVIIYNDQIKVIL